MSILVIALILFSGFYVATFYRTKYSFLGMSASSWLWVYHVLFGVIFYGYTISHPADAQHYWDTASDTEWFEVLDYLTQARGTQFMYALNYLPAAVLDLSYLAGTLIYTFIGYIGLLCFIRVSEKIIPYNTYFYGIKLFPMIFFLPNLHFWSVGIGKDTICFFSIGVLVYCLINVKKRWFLAIIAFTLLYYTRSHIALLFLLSAGVCFLFIKKVNIFVRISIGVCVLCGIVFIFPHVMEYVGIQDLAIDTFTSRTAKQANLLARSAGSSLDISSYPYPLKIFTFLYRPLFFDANNIVALVASVENLILLSLSFRAFISRIKVRKMGLDTPFVINLLFCLLLLGTLVYSFSLGNLGIMLRMRNMFLPGMLISIMWIFSYTYSVESSYKLDEK